MTDWTPTYLANLPQRQWGDIEGDCSAMSVATGMEWCAIRQKQPACVLSELDLYYQGRAAAGHITTHSGITVANACQQAKANGVASDVLWSGNQRTFDYDHDKALVDTPPPANAVADRPLHKLIDYQAISGFTSAADLMAKVAPFIDSGYAVCVWCPTRHVVCALGYEGTSFITLDGRSMTPGPLRVSQDDVYAGMATFGPLYVIKTVSFTGSPEPTPWRKLTGQPSNSANPTMNANLTLKSYPAQLTPAQPFSAVFTLTNVGSSTLAGNSSIRLGSAQPYNTGIWNAVGPVTQQGGQGARVVLPQDVPPGATIDMTGQFTAPPTAGNYTFAWQPVQEGVVWFGQTVSVVIAVSGSVQPPQPTTSWTGTFSASVDSSGKLTGTFTSS